MAYSPKAVANYFLRRGHHEGVDIDAMKLQKLIYFAHGWHLAIHGEPLIDEPVEAWPYGPVIPTVYEEFKRFGRQPIHSRARDFDGFDLIAPEVPVEDDRTRAVLDRIWQVYGGLSAIELSNMTHVQGSPWDHAWQNRGTRRRRIDIDDGKIQDYFRRLAVRREDR